MGFVAPAFLAPSFLCVALVGFMLPWIRFTHDVGEFGPRISLVVLSQTGLQVMSGDVSPGLGLGMAPLPTREVSAAPLMIVFLLLTLAAAVLGFVFGGLSRRVAKPLRIVLVSGCTGVASAVLIAQVASGFPFVDALQRTGGEAMFEGARLKWGYAFGFWLTALSLVAAIVGVIVDGINGPRPARRRPSRRRRDDDEW